MLPTPLLRSSILPACQPASTTCSISQPLHTAYNTPQPSPPPSPRRHPAAAVENDDRPGLFSLADLLPLHAIAGTPLVFDYLHHALVPGGLSQRDALLAALATWPRGIRPVVHYR